MVKNIIIGYNVTVKMTFGCSALFIIKNIITMQNYDSRHSYDKTKLWTGKNTIFKVKRMGWW